MSHIGEKQYRVEQLKLFKQRLDAGVKVTGFSSKVHCHKTSKVLFTLRSLYLILCNTRFNFCYLLCPAVQKGTGFQQTERLPWRGGAISSEMQVCEKSGASEKSFFFLCYNSFISRYM